MKNRVDQLKAQGNYEEGLGLHADEIATLKNRLAHDIPPFFIAYLEAFGFNPNVFWAVFNEEDDFIEQNEMIQELGYANFLAIGDEYNENLLLANAENQQLFLLEDDHLIDLQVTFAEMLDQAVEERGNHAEVNFQQITAVYSNLQGYKPGLVDTVKTFFNQLIAEAQEQKDDVYGLILVKDPKNNGYKIAAGSFNDFKSEIEQQPLDFDKLWNPEQMKYQVYMPIAETLLEVKTEVERKAMDLLLLDVLRELKSEGYFEAQLEGFSLSIQSGEVNFFPEDFYDESLMKENGLESKIKRFWESPYDRTRVLIETL